MAKKTQTTVRELNLRHILVAVGYETELVEDYDRFLPDFKPNANVTKTETKEKQIAEKKAAFDSKASRLPLFSRLKRIHATRCLPGSQSVYAVFEETEGASVALKFWDWLAECNPNAWPVNPFDPFPAEKSVMLFAFEADNLCRMVAFDLMRETKDLRQIPLRFWRSNELALDPTHVILDSESRKTITLDVLLDFAGLKEMDRKNPYEPFKDAESDARVVMSLIWQYNLTGKGQ